MFVPSFNLMVTDFHASVGIIDTCSLLDTFIFSGILNPGTQVVQWKNKFDFDLSFVSAIK